MTNKSKQLGSIVNQLFEIEEDINGKRILDDFQISDIEKRKDLKGGILRLISKEKPDLSSVKSCISDIMSIWNNSVGILTELFWLQIEIRKLEIKRKDPLIQALEKGYLHHSIRTETRYNWDGLIKSKLLETRFTNENLTNIKRMIEEDEKNKVMLLRKCLNKPKMVNSNYLKYGEALGYLTKGNLFKDYENKTTLLDNYFTKEEIRRLDEIWDI